MARQQTADVEQVDTNDRIASVLEQLAAQAPVQEIGYGHPKFQDRLREEGFMDAFAAPVYQNGKEAVARGLTPETIARAPQLKPGTYLGGKVEVAHDHHGRVHLRYPHAKVTDRMRFQAVASSFDDLVGKIWAEMHAA